ncbi:uncharacterized protein, partial [Parasteatoda tepidariorum]|uniref:uncharacterized protein n=1 Tax=Parasteatoda tepidariorum TaxID=114398 RepID=UPI001C727A6C
MEQKTLLRSVHKECFYDEEGKNSLKNFQVFSDYEEILRLKSRLLNEDETPEFIAPFILPSKHIVVTRLIEQEHLLNKHAGTSILLTILRERFWIIKDYRLDYRTRLSAVFEVTGVDLAGPLTKTNKKVWIVLFSCAVYRTVHLELIPSLSTNAFVQALRRFIARRSRVSTLYSDNGTNFTGLNASLKRLDWTKIMKEFEVSQIQWKFNPPSAPWWGGFWERLIGILKDLFRKNLGRSSLTHVELSTLVYECESTTNNRPMTYVSEEPDLRALTPSSFLHDLPTND